MTNTYEYVPLETLVTNFCRYGLQYTIEDNPDGIDGTLVTIWTSKLASKRLNAKILFRNGKLVTFNFNAHLVEIGQLSAIAGIERAAKGIIKRHEYHEARKRGDES